MCGGGLRPPRRRAEETVNPLQERGYVDMNPRSDARGVREDGPLVSRASRTYSTIPASGQTFATEPPTPERNRFPLTGAGPGETGMGGP